MDQCSYPRDARDRISRQRNATSRPSMDASRELVALPRYRRDTTRYRSNDLCLGGASRLRCRPKSTIHTDSERALRRESQSDVRGLDLGLPWRRARDAKRVVGRIASGRGWCHPPRGPSGRAQVGTGVGERLCRVPKSRSSVPLAAGFECQWARRGITCLSDQVHELHGPGGCVRRKLLCSAKTSVFAAGISGITEASATTSFGCAR